jgi:HD-like signal output (HDOD) protein/GGDEF domain-containing protein
MNSVDLDGDVLTHFINRARRMYSLPAVALRVLELTASSTVDVAALAACIEQDPALTTKILRVVNSSLYGLNQRVSTVKQSIAILGTQPLKMLVLGFSLPGNLASSSGTIVLQRFWQQALLTALAAREIAEGWFHHSGDEAFAAGLLQDLGLLILIQDLGETYDKFLVGVWQQGSDLIDEENRVLGFDHRVLTTKLLGHWHLPEALVTGIAGSHDAEFLDEHELPHVLYLAERVALFLVDRQPARLQDLLQVGGRSCQLTMPKLELLVASLERRMPQLAELMSLELPGEMVYSDVLLQAYKRLCDTTDQVAVDCLALPTRSNQVLWERVALLSGLSADSDEIPVAISMTAASMNPDSSSDGALRTTATVCPTANRTGLIGQIRGEVARCRQARSAISLVIVELDECLNRTLGSDHDARLTLVDQLGSTIQEIIASDGHATPIEQKRFALLLRCDRRRAVDIGWRITDSVRSWSDSRGQRLRTAISVSVGVATLSMPPRNFPAEE